MACKKGDRIGIMLGGACIPVFIGVFSDWKFSKTSGVQYEQWVNETRKKIEVGSQELERGEGIDLDAAMEQLIAKVQNARKQTL